MRESRGERREEEVRYALLYFRVRVRSRITLLYDSLYFTLTYPTLPLRSPHPPNCQSEPHSLQCRRTRTLKEEKRRGEKRR